MEQIRAARALLGWSQGELAEQSGLSQTGIARIENGSNHPNSTTLDKITTAFDRADIEFIDHSGVKKRTNKVISYSGAEGFKRFREDVLEEARSNDNADICIANLDERLFDKWGEGEVNDNYRQAMAEIRQKNKNLMFRSITKEGDKHFSASRHSEYKWVAERDFGPFPYYIFGNKTAMIMFEEDNITLFILDHPLITKFYRDQFEKMWLIAQDPE
ncbi:MAG: helix-turn-helix domain-containing protein [Alphaproteobacteria bacterium]|nr:helix-turn-helix domain-containing protein [Alphaproteobacteria bacterium]